MSSVPIGFAQSDTTVEDSDSLPRTLHRARRLGTGGTLPVHRQLWRYCGQAFRDWYGGQLAMDQPVIAAVALTKLEIAELLQLAEEMPAVIRDLLRLREQARTSKHKLALSRLEWSPERRQMLIELHRIALFCGGVQLNRARQARDRAVQDRKRGNYERSCQQRERMVAECLRQIATLESQLHALTAS